jgi:hypothetical protein
MKKIDILNFITNFRKLPNDIKTHTLLVSHFGESNELKLNELIAELKQTKVIRESEVAGEKAYQVVMK